MSHCLPDLSSPCTIKKRNSSLSFKQFLEELVAKMEIKTIDSLECIYFLFGLLKVRVDRAGHSHWTLFTGSKSGWPNTLWKHCKSDLILPLQAFRAHSTKYRLLREYGQDVITVATANTHSYRKGWCMC